MAKRRSRKAAPRVVKPAPVKKPTRKAKKITPPPPVPPVAITATAPVPENLEQVVVLIDARTHVEPIAHGRARVVLHQGRHYEYTGMDAAGRRMYRQR